VYTDPIALIQEGVVLDFKSESPITTSNFKKTKCTLFARKGELIFMHSRDKLGAVLKLLRFGILATLAVMYFYSDQLQLGDTSKTIIMYGGFALYALLPKLQNSKSKTLTAETLEKLDFEGQITRLYWRELLHVTEPSRTKAVLSKPAELDLGYHTLLVHLSDESFQQAVAIASGAYVIEPDKSEY
jgi:hypothetical protein